MGKGGKSKNLALKGIEEEIEDSEDKEEADLLVKLDETTRLVETLVVENTSLEEKVKNLEVEFSQARTQIEGCLVQNLMRS